MSPWSPVSCARPLYVNSVFGRCTTVALMNALVALEEFSPFIPSKSRFVLALLVVER